MPRLATKDELKDYLGSSVVGADTLLNLMIESSERFVERYTGRRFSPLPASDSDPVVAKTIKLTDERAIVRVPDVREVASVTLDGVTLAEESDYTLGDYEAASPASTIRLFERPALSRIEPVALLVITGRFGFSPVPPDVKDAVLTIAARRYRDRDASWSDALQLSEGGILSYFAQLPSNTKMILQSYKLPKMALVGS